MAKKHLISITLIIILSVVIYANTFKNEFVFDDIKLIVENYNIRNLTNIPHFSLMKQPVREITFALDYHFWKLNPSGYHLTNVILHILCSISVYFFVLGIGSKNSKSHFLLPTSYFPLIVALLFAVHPIHTEAVAGISNRKEMLSMLFLFLSIILYMKSKYIPSILLFIVALLSKFTAIILPFILLLYELFRDIRPETKDQRLEVKKQGSWVFGLRSLVYLLPYFLILIFAVVYGFIHFDEIFWQAKAVGLTGEKYFVILLTMFKAFGYYVRLLILPYNLCAEYMVPFSRSFFSLPVLTSLLFIFILIFIASYLFKRNKIVSFSIFFFFISFLPMSNLIPATYIIAERYMYIPSFGFCLLVGWFVSLLVGWKKYVGISLLTVIIVVFSGLTIKRNYDWKDGYTLWSKTVKQSPNSAVAHNNLGVAYDDRGERGKAVSLYEKAIQLNPSYKEAYYNLALAYVEMGLYEKADSLTDKVLELDPGCARIHTTSGTILIGRGLYDDALRELEIAEAIEPQNPNTHLGLGYIYEKKGETDRAIQHYKRSLDIDPDYEQAYFNIGNVYTKKGLYDEAISSFKKAIELNPLNAETYFNLADVCEKVGKINEAIGAYKNFLEHWDGDPVYSNIVRERIKRLEESMK